jgi:hypothetical protein
MNTLADIPTNRLRQILSATEQSVGADSQSAAVLRDELRRRGPVRLEQDARPAPSRPATEARP